MKSHRTYKKLIAVPLCLTTFVSMASSNLNAETLPTCENLKKSLEKQWDDQFGEKSRSVEMKIKADLDLLDRIEDAAEASQELVYEFSAQSTLINCLKNGQYFSNEGVKNPTDTNLAKQAIEERNKCSVPMIRALSDQKNSAWLDKTSSTSIASRHFYIEFATNRASASRQSTSGIAIRFDLSSNPPTFELQRPKEVGIANPFLSHTDILDVVIKETNNLTKESIKLGEDKEQFVKTKPGVNCTGTN